MQFALDEDLISECIIIYLYADSNYATVDLLL